MSEGMYFSKIAVLGHNKPTAQVIFDKGLNVISGASETGKSYIVECMNFILGSSLRDQPKPITQSQGYQKVQAEIRFFDGKTVTLSRHFDDNLIYASECSFEDFEKTEKHPLSVKHSEKTDNISGYLLSSLQLNGKMLKDTRFNGTNPLSFRDFARLLLVKEKRIITEDSPVFDEFSPDKTENKSLFKFIVSGEDDSSLPQYDNPEFQKSRIKGKIELLRKDIAVKEVELLQLKSASQALTTDEINVQIQKLITVIEGTFKELKQYEQNREDAWSEVSRLKAILMHNEEIEKRFNLLNVAYSSDLDRLEFINEGKIGIEQVKKINCPLCNSLVEEKLLEPVNGSDEKDADFLSSVRAEYSKIVKKQADLELAINDVHDKIKDTESQLAIRTQEFQRIDKYITDKLKPIHQISSDNLQSFLKLRDERAKAVMIESQLSERKESLDRYTRMVDEKQPPAPETKVPVNMFDEFCNNVKDVLLSWGADCNRVTFNHYYYDIEIDGVKRGLSGKGYRAIYFSAFMVGLLQHCIKNRLIHPHFLVLDSPLTTFKERDGVTLTSSREILPENIQNKFYESLSNIDYLKRVQIVIIDNRPPPDDVSKRINHIHFTKNRGAGRYGFFPV
jgi:hypothetical protein